MLCPKCQSDDLFYDGVGLQCGNCNHIFENIGELEALEIAFKKKSKKNQVNAYNKKIESEQVQQTKKQYLRTRYFEIEE